MAGGLLRGAPLAIRHFLPALFFFPHASLPNTGVSVYLTKPYCYSPPSILY